MSRTVRWILLIVAVYFVVGATVVLTLAYANTATTPPDRVDPALNKQK